MKMLTMLGLSIESPLALPGAPNYRPESWPPPPDWPVVIDAQGKVISRWRDPVWRLDPWAKRALTLNFGDGPATKNAAPISRRTLTCFVSSQAGGYTGRTALVAIDLSRRVSIRCVGYLFFAKRQEYLRVN